MLALNLAKSKRHPIHFLELLKKIEYSLSLHASILQSRAWQRHDFAKASEPPAGQIVDCYTSGWSPSFKLCKARHWFLSIYPVIKPIDAL